MIAAPPRGRRGAPAPFSVKTLYPKTNPLVMGGFCAYILIWFLQAGYRKSILGAVRIEFCVAAALGAAVLFMKHRIPASYKVKSSPLPFYVGLLFLAMLLAIPFSHALSTSLFILQQRVIKFAFMGLFIGSFVKSPGDMRYFLLAFLAACGFITQESFRHALDGSMVWMNQGVPRLHGDTPLFFHPNSLAGLAIGVLPFVYFLLPVVRPKSWRWPLLGVGMTAAGCVMYSGSRTAYVALGVFYVFVLWASKSRLKILLLSLALGAVLLPSVPQAYRDRFMTIFTGEEIEGKSMDTRKVILKDAIEIFKRHPFGVGVAAFPAVRKVTFGRHQDTHNLYLEVATNLGIQGLFIFCLFIHKLLKSFLGSRNTLDAQAARLEEILRSGAAPPEKAPVLQGHLDDLRLLSAVSLAGMGYILIRLALGLFGMDMYEIYWWIGVGLAVSLFNVEQISRRITDELAGPALPAVKSKAKAWSRAAAA